MLPKLKQSQAYPSNTSPLYIIGGSRLLEGHQDTVWNIHEAQLELDPVYYGPADFLDKEIRIKGRPKGVIDSQVDQEQFRIIYSDGKNDILTYQEVIDHLFKKEEENSEQWLFSEILDHRRGRGQRRG